MKNVYLKLILLVIVISLVHQIAPAPLKYPKTNKSKNITDIYHGKIIEDEYRWLEDDNSKQTKAWCKNKMLLQIDTSEKFPIEKKLKKINRVMELSHIEYAFIKGDKIYFYKNDGLQNQSVFYTKSNMDEPDSWLL